MDSLLEKIKRFLSRGQNLINKKKLTPDHQLHTCNSCSVKDVFLLTLSPSLNTVIHPDRMQSPKVPQAPQPMHILHSELVFKPLIACICTFAVLE